MGSLLHASLAAYKRRPYPRGALYHSVLRSNCRRMRQLLAVHEQESLAMFYSYSWFVSKDALSSATTYSPKCFGVVYACGLRIEFHVRCCYTALWYANLSSFTCRSFGP